MTYITHIGNLGLVLTPTTDDSASPLRQRRRAAGLTQVQLAEQAGCAQGVLSDFETGKASPSLATARRIAAVLDCTLDELFGGTDE